jgi:hypothetical protein
MGLCCCKLGKLDELCYPERNEVGVHPDLEGGSGDALGGVLNADQNTLSQRKCAITYDLLRSMAYFAQQPPSRIADVDCLDSQLSHMNGNPVCPETAFACRDWRSLPMTGSHNKLTPASNAR